MIALIVSFGYLLAYFIVVNFQVVESSVNPYVSFASILFFPHGVRVLTTLIFRSTAGFFYLLCASVINEIIFVGFNLEQGIIMQVVRLTIGAASAPLAFFIVSFAIGKDLTYLAKPNSRSWRVLSLLTLASAAINGFGQAVVAELGGNELPSLKLQAAFVFGDTFGAFSVLLGAYLFVRVTYRKN